MSVRIEMRRRLSLPRFVELYGATPAEGGNPKEIVVPIPCDDRGFMDENQFSQGMASMWKILLPLQTAQWQENKE